MADFNQLLTLNPTKFSTIGNVVHHPQVNANIQSCELTFVVKPSGPHLKRWRGQYSGSKWKSTKLKSVSNIIKSWVSYIRGFLKLQHLWQGLCSGEEAERPHYRLPWSHPGTSKLLFSIFSFWYRNANMYSKLYLICVVWPSLVRNITTNTLICSKENSFSSFFNI